MHVIYPAVESFILLMMGTQGENDLSSQGFYYQKKHPQVSHQQRIHYRDIGGDNKDVEDVTGDKDTLLTHWKSAEGKLQRG